MALSAEQRRNAAIIIEVGSSLGASQRDLTIALMTAMQESGLRNLSYGHLDSVGLFQQRNAWGSFSQRTNPRESARMFFQGGRGGQRGLFDIKNRNRMRLTAAAQAVQVSAFPEAYAKHESVARSLLGSGAARSGSGGFYRPVGGGRITQRFGDPAPAGVTYARGYKNGMSFAAPHGSPIRASASGRVVRVTSGGAYGNRVEIEHGGKIWTLYAHMAGTNVSVGQRVQAGQVIGTVGATGQATGSHLHFEVRRGANSYYSAVNPQPFLNMNTTPGAYIQDNVFSDTITVPFEGEIDDMMPTQADEAFNPYVYVDPLAQFLTVEQGIVSDDSLGALVPEQDRKYVFEQEASAMADTEVQLPEPRSEPEPVEMI